MRYAVRKISLAVVVGVGVSASWLSAQPENREQVWLRRNIDADYGYVFKGGLGSLKLNPAMTRCYQKCMEQVYNDDKLIRPDTFRKCVNAHLKMPDGCEEW